MLVLGLNVWHDRAACVVGEAGVLMAIAEERLDRVKHSLDPLRIPALAVAYCCARMNLTLDDFDAIVITSPESSPGVEPRWLVQLRALGHTKPHRVHSLAHHLGHAASAYFASPFDDALIWVADGAGSYVGDLQEAESAFVGTGREIRSVWQRLQGRVGSPGQYQLSLGRKYEQATSALGFEPAFGQAGKTMALAAFGNSERFRSAQLGVVSRSDLSLEVTNTSFQRELHQIASTTPMPKFKLEDEVRGPWADVASHFQAFVEAATVTLVDELAHQTGMRNICLAGGVALNCVVNQRLSEALPQAKFYVQPASGDDGQALGAALYGLHVILGHNHRAEIKVPALGPRYSRSEVSGALSGVEGVSIRAIDDPARTTADLLAQGEAVAWFQGSSEFGPRALGHRSILASPLVPRMKEYLNVSVKRRERFRPFACAIAEDALSRYTSFPPASPNMLFAVPLDRPAAQELTAVLHEDGTSRIQVVSPALEPTFYRLLHEIGRDSTHPVVLNTSFNVDREPIVETPADAVASFKAIPLQSMVLEGFLVQKTI